MKRLPDVPGEIQAEGAKLTRKRMRALRTYIASLTVRPSDVREIVAAVVFDLNEVFTRYDGDFDKACGDSRSWTREKASSGASNEE